MPFYRNAPMVPRQLHRPAEFRPDGIYRAFPPTPNKMLGYVVEPDLCGATGACYGPYSQVYINRGDGIADTNPATKLSPSWAGDQGVAVCPYGAIWSDFLPDLPRDPELMLHLTLDTLYISDSSGMGSLGNVYGTLSNVSARFGSGIQGFSSNSRRIEVPIIEATRVGAPNESFAYSFWCRNNSGWGQMGLFHGATNLAGATPLNFWQPGSNGSLGMAPVQWLLTASDNTQYNIMGGAPFNNGSWRHILLLRDAPANECRVYLDSGLTFTMSVPGSKDFRPANGNLFIGGGGTATSYVWGAYYSSAGFDDIRIYRGLLTQAHIDALYAGTM